ncbi:MAG: M23 family metallopeptidase [Sphingomonadales bacterium]|nr:M23 family metallopeptidase [Sphingomonadales bacterium]MDE2568316.1 M23 family metallopeptidase [Sphingomonadales bacterium]
MHTAREQLAGSPAGNGATAPHAPLRRSQASLSLVAPADALPSPGLLTRWRLAFETRFVDFDWAPDLAEAIGSARWFRGLAMLVALTIAALAFWPSFSPVEAAPMVRMDLSASEEMRSLAIRPLAQGATSGRHWDATSLVVPLSSAPERPSVHLVATLGEGDSFERMMQRAGVSGLDAARVASLVGGVIPATAIQPGTRFDITLGRRDDPAVPRPLQAIAFRARFDLDLSITRTGGGLELARSALAVDDTPLRIRGIVGSSLYRSARAAGAPASAIQEYLQTLDQHGMLDTMAPSDEYDMVLGYKRAAGGAVQVGSLLYAGLERDGKPRTELVRMGGAFTDALDDGSPAGSPAETLSLGMPVANGHETSGFGLRRHPILGYVRMHDGIDYGAPFGSAIYAVADGVVMSAGWRGGYGNFVMINHGGGITSGYGHMSRLAVSPGQGVQRGQVIGYVGSTGLSTGPHVHFEVRRSGRPVDPSSVSFVVRQQAAAPAASLPAVRERLKVLMSVEPGAALSPLK